MRPKTNGGSVRSETHKGPRRFPAGLVYRPNFIPPGPRQEILKWLRTLHPLWEYRYSTRRPLGGTETQRKLLRPVYWMGNWQFACLNYYHPPKGIHHRCVRAEPYPAVLQTMVRRIEAETRATISRKEIPPGWHLNTCLINFYGDRREGERWIDTGRVGEHKDFEPGPVASVSLGERAFFQFVESRHRHGTPNVVFQQWLDDSSLQIFAGPLWKERFFHRVQRVEKKGKHQFDLQVEDFRTRRINFTFRYVPEQHILKYSQLPNKVAHDIEDYVSALAEHSAFFKAASAERRSHVRLENSI